MDKLNLDSLDHGESLDAAVVESIVVEKADFDHALKVCVRSFSCEMVVHAVGGVMLHFIEVTPTMSLTQP